MTDRASNMRWSVGEDATGAELGRFASEHEAANFIDTLDPAKVHAGCYWLTDMETQENEQ